MEWKDLLSVVRFGQEDREFDTQNRTEFQRDYDRLIFSSPFRRMQDKTQVFPLPGSVFVHNRLTHSLEVASVGRSMAKIVEIELLKEYPDLKNTLFEEISTIVATACLAHDMGNPPFGHSGEDAISDFFKNNKDLKQYIPDDLWCDFTCFEGNANALRVLTHKFKGRRKGGFALTYSSLASIIKYPYESKHRRNKDKYGFFYTEIENYKKIASKLKLPKDKNDSNKYVRHPLVYIVEAADDICYQIMDIEDAHKLKILSHKETLDLLLAFFDEEDKEFNHKFKQIKEDVTDKNEVIAYLRAGVINKLVNKCADVFLLNYTKIMQGEDIASLIHCLSGTTKQAMDECIKIAFSKIYVDKRVLEIEIAGYKILATLLNEFINAVLQPSKTYSKILLSIIPEQYKTDNKEDYLNIQSIVDFVTGMTDLYALDLYRKIKGISLPTIGS